MATKKAQVEPEVEPGVEMSNDQKLDLITKKEDEIRELKKSLKPYQAPPLATLQEANAGMRAARMAKFKGRGNVSVKGASSSAPLVLTDQ